MAKLSDKDVEAADKEQKELAINAAKQCFEQVELMSREISRDINLSLEQRQALTDVLTNHGFRLSLCRVTDDNAEKKMSVQVSYEIDDLLYAYLQQPDDRLPRALRGFLDGGIVLDTKAIAVDPMPKTGKTKWH